MSPREILQFNTLMNEGAVDRALAIKGEFSQECSKLQSLIDEWDKRGKIDARLQDLAMQTSRFQEETKAFDETVANLQARIDKVDEREKAAAAKEMELSGKEAATILAASQLGKEKDDFAARMFADLNSLADARAAIAAQQSDIYAQQQELAKREKAVADKLAALKALAA